MKVIYTLIIFLICTAGCRKFIDVGLPGTELSSEAVFDKEVTAKAVVAALYVKVQGLAGHNQGWTVFGGFTADEANAAQDYLDGRQMNNNEIVPTNGIMSTLWTEYYNYIYQANVIIEGVAASQKLSMAAKAQFTGEALFMRAFSHYYLTCAFGSAAYITSTDYRANTIAARIPRQQVLDKIQEDLLAAKPLLPDNYSASNGERTRVNRAVVNALLARIYLWKKDYANAAATAGALLDSTNTYALVPLNNVFLKNSREAILQFVPGYTNNGGILEGAMFIIEGTPGTTYLRPEFVAAFEPGDQRRTNWVGTYSYGATTWHYPYKYKIGNGTGNGTTEYSTTFRLAEMYLIRAEARVYLNDLGGAKDDLDAIRSRAGLGGVTITTKDDMLLAVEKERRMELFAEWAHRWIDLNRTGRATAVLGTIKTGWEVTDSIFPVPQTEVLVNVNMRQNPGY